MRRMNAKVALGLAKLGASRELVPGSCDTPPPVRGVLLRCAAAVLTRTWSIATL